MKVDFIHIGFHKTASTWMQLYGFAGHADIVLCNDPEEPSLDRLFVDELVEKPDFCFDPGKFRDEFFSAVVKHKGLEEGKIYGISEENISGHFWNGAEGELLADRVRTVFGETKIIIFVRNQFDMLLSLYSNYVKNGGTKSLKQLFADQTMWGDRITLKLCYHHLVERYVELFGKENVLLLCFEEFKKDLDKTMNEIFSFVGAGEFRISEKKSRRVNIRVSVPSEITHRMLNAAGLSSRFVRKVTSFADSFLAEHWRREEVWLKSILDPEAVELWRHSNSILQQYMRHDLQANNYLLK